MKKKYIKRENPSNTLNYNLSTQTAKFNLIPFFFSLTSLLSAGREMF